MFNLIKSSKIIWRKGIHKILGDADIRPYEFDNLNIMCSRVFKSINNLKIITNVNYITLKRTLHNNHPELNLEYICDPKNVDIITKNVTRRKGVGNIQIVQELYHKMKDKELHSPEIEDQFYTEAKKIPNDTHPEVIHYENDPKIIKYLGNKPEFNFKPREFHEITKKLNLMRTEQLGNVAGSRSYYFLGILAELEQALIKYTIQKLVRLGYQIISVPDIVHSNVIESCGMTVKGERTQIYTLDPALHGSDLCLSGTSEMAIAGFFANKVIPVEKMPVKLAAVSRCYRAETSNVAEERGIYRVHQFTKVEMFALTKPSDSEQMLESFREFQEEHFKSLGLHLQILDMPPHELGAPAYRKYDLEAWLPGRNIYGEVSSCSNCTDYQSRRLGIKYELENGDLVHVHTVNGTACAIPRMLIALIETYQTDKGIIHLPDCLKQFLRGQEFISKQKKIPELKLKKVKR